MGEKLVAVDQDETFVGSEARFKRLLKRIC